ncbi:MAG: response regulator [Anaerolineae bacterium]|nr:response regulator [Anaerolineae bacterium]
MPRILVIEDESTILENIVETLTLEDFDVRGAANGRIGVQIAIEYLPELIICDIMMPEMNGYDVLLELRGNRQTAKVPFIFLTAKAEREDMRKGMELGADDYLTKPFTNAELLAAINARLERHTNITEPYARQMDDLRQNVTRALPHELRTPLTGIIGYSEMLLMDIDSMRPEQIRNMVQVIYKSGMRLHRVIENYLFYAQLELMHLDPKKVEAARNGNISKASSVIPDVASRIARTTKRLDDLTVQVAALDIRITPEHLAKIIEEVVDNAVKFSDSGTPIQINGKADGNTFVLTINDQGRGMTSDQIETIGAYMQFERKVYEQQGLGLGLAITRRISELYGGHLAIQSTPEQGTAVSITLPM